MLRQYLERKSEDVNATEQDIYRILTVNGAKFEPGEDSNIDPIKKIKSSIEALDVKEQSFIEAILANFNQKVANGIFDTVQSLVVKFSNLHLFTSSEKNVNEINLVARQPELVEINCTQINLLRQTSSFTHKIVGNITFRAVFCFEYNPQNAKTTIALQQLIITITASDFTHKNLEHFIKIATTKINSKERLNVLDKQILACYLKEKDILNATFIDKLILHNADAYLFFIIKTFDDPKNKVFNNYFMMRTKSPGVTKINYTQALNKCVAIIKAINVLIKEAEIKVSQESCNFLFEKTISDNKKLGKNSSEKLFCICRLIMIFHKFVGDKNIEHMQLSVDEYKNLQYLTVLDNIKKIHDGSLNVDEINKKFPIFAAEEIFKTLIAPQTDLSLKP